jgi:hypothetical protein
MERRSALLLSVGVFVVGAVIALVLARPPGAAPFGAGSTVSPSPRASMPPLMETADLYAAFAKGGVASSSGTPTTLSTVSAGDLVLPTGRVVATDIFFVDTEPFARSLPAGRHPVSLLWSTQDPALGGDVAAAMIRVAPGDPVSWELALVAGQDPATLKPDEFFGYGVDSGTGCFASAEALAVLTAENFDSYAERVQKGMSPSDGVFNSTVDLTVDEATGANVIGFRSGYGDGAYPSWFGLDADGEPLVLLTDFGILDARPS